MARNVYRLAVAVTAAAVAALSTAHANSSATSTQQPRAEKQVSVHCECSAVAPATNACRDLSKADSADIVAWFESAYPPPNPDFDWGAFCFNKRGQYAPASVCCDHLEDESARYYRGTPKP